MSQAHAFAESLAAPVNPAARQLESSPVHAGDEASAYDEMVSRYRWLLNRPFLNLASRAGTARARVLDIGCGPGWVPVELARRHPDWRITALDPSEDMLKLGRATASQAGVAARIQFLPGTAPALSFPNGQFDLVISNYVLHHLECPRAFFDEAARLVRPGGQVLIKDLLRPAPWKASLLLAFSKYVLRYDRFQLRMYRESLAAALTLEEMRAEVARSRLAGATVQMFRGLDVVIRFRKTGV